MSKYFSIVAVIPLDSHGGSKRYIFTPKQIPDYAFKKEYYTFNQNDFSRLILQSKHVYLETLLQWKRMHRLDIACFGAAAKAISFFNYLGIDKDVISYCVDETPSKWGKLMPKSNIPILSLQDYESKTKKPDVMLITAWNFWKEIKDKLKHPACWVKSPNGEFKRV